MEMTKTDYEAVAKLIMEEMQYENGYGHVEGISFPAKWVKRIAEKAQLFFDANPGMLIDETIEELASGCMEEREEKYRNLPHYSALDKVLNDYFDDGMHTGIVEVKPRLMHTYQRIKK